MVTEFLIFIICIYAVYKYDKIKIKCNATSIEIEVEKSR